MIMIERIARVLEPQAWAALGIGDTLAYRNRRVSSLRKARKSVQAMQKPTDEIERALDEVPGGWGRGAWLVGIEAALAVPVCDATGLELREERK